MTGLGSIRLASRKRLPLSSSLSLPVRGMTIIAYPPPSKGESLYYHNRKAFPEYPCRTVALVHPEDRRKRLHGNSIHVHSPSVRWLSTLSKPQNKAYYNGANPESVLELLTDAGLDFEETAEHAVIKECPFCHPIKGDPSNMYKLHVKLQNGVYNCFRCGAKGSWTDLKRKLASNTVFAGGQPSAMARNGVTRMPSPVANYPLHSNFPPSFEPAKQDTTRKQKTLPLPMPEHGKQAIYSSRLLDEDNVYLQYLMVKRGLTKNTLRKYGVGLAKYKFYSKKTNSHVEHESYTFPWQLNIRQIEAQEAARGAKFVHKILDLVEHSPKHGLFADEESVSSGNNKVSNGTTSQEEPAENDNNEEEDSRPIWEIENWNAAPEEDDEDSIKDEYWLARRMKVRAVRQKSLQRMEPPGGGWGLFGLHTIPSDATEIVLTEGEYDAMAVYQATGRPAISVPNGASSFPDEVLPLLEKYKTIYLWMDNDDPGRKGAKMVASKLGVGRCKMVIPTLENCNVEDPSMLPKDANEALVRNIDLGRIVDDAKPPRHEKIKTFNSLRDSVLDLILNPDKYKGHSMLSLQNFSTILGGFRNGEMTVLTGPTGAGKTTFLSQFSLDMAEQGIPVLWGSFEIKNQRLIHKLMNQFAQKKLDKDDQAALMEVSKRFEKLPFNFMDFHGSSNIDDVLETMTYAGKLFAKMNKVPIDRRLPLTLSPSLLLH